MINSSTNYDNQILFVSAGMDKPKKRDHALARRQQYLNYGALTLATILDSKGYAVKLIHGGHLDPWEFAKRLHMNGLLSTHYPLMLSMQSFYALSWTKSFTEAVKQLSPNIKIVLGGRWVVGEYPEWLRTKLPLVDQFVKGLAENKVVNLVENSGSGLTSGIQQVTAVPYSLKHALVDDFKEFQPNVEASRGCGMGCSFCEERDIPLTPLKDPKKVAEQLQDVADQYGETNVRPYVQSSFFAPNTSWSERFASAVASYQNKIIWRCETRVDAIKPASIAALAEGGLRVIDLGLESASPVQILRMRKSKKPDAYLRSASDLIEACHKNGVLVKVNFLLYAGETASTYNETTQWLDDYAEAIKGVSAGPVVVFGSPKTAQGFLSDIYTAGGSLVNPSQIALEGIGKINLSRSISAEDAEILSLKASKRYMNMRDYFDLKSFSYYPRSYTFEKFKKDVQGGCADNLPFSISTNES